MTQPPTSSSASAGGSSISSAAGSLLRDLPVRNPLAFSALGKSDPAKSHPVVYYATHDRTQPPSDQVITTEKTNILLRQFHQLAEAKRERLKRSVDSPVEPDAKLPRRE